MTPPAISSHGRRLAALLAATLILSSNLAVAQPRWRGDIGFVLGYGLERNERALSRVEANLSAKQRLVECEARLGVRLRYDRNLEPESHNELEIRNGEFACRRERWLVSVGRQSVVWGKTDGFPVLDIVHPFDLREFVLDGLEASRRPLTMLRLEHSVSDEAALQLLLIGEHRTDVLPGPGSRFAPTLPRTELDALADRDGSQGRWGLDSGQFGLKWEYTGNDLSYTFNLLNRLSLQPHFEFDGASGALQRKFARQWVFGGSFDYPLAKWVVRGEAAYVSRVDLAGQHAATTGPDFARFKEFTWMSGIDRPLGDWFLSGQFIETRNFGTELDQLVTGPRRLLSLLASRSYLQDRLHIDLFAAHDVSDRGTWYDLKLRYDVDAHLTIFASLDILSGTSRSALGRVDREDRLTFGAHLSI